MSVNSPRDKSLNLEIVVDKRLQDENTCLQSK